MIYLGLLLILYIWDFCWYYIFGTAVDIIYLGLLLILYTVFGTAVNIIYSIWDCCWYYIFGTAVDIIYLGLLLILYIWDCCWYYIYSGLLLILYIRDCCWYYIYSGLLLILYIRGCCWSYIFGTAVDLSIRDCCCYPASLLLQGGVEGGGEGERSRAKRSAYGPAFLLGTRQLRQLLPLWVNIPGHSWGQAAQNTYTVPTSHTVCCEITQLFVTQGVDSTQPTLQNTIVYAASKNQLIKWRVCVPISLRMPWGKLQVTVETNSEL